MFAVKLSVIIAILLPLNRCDIISNYEKFCEARIFHHSEINSFKLEWCTEENCCNSIYARYPPDTKFIKIGETNIIPAYAFANSSKLLYISGVNSKIEVLGGKSFFNLEKLLNIHLPFNKIREIHSDVFVNVAASFLDLSWNKIFYVEKGAFDGLHNLKHLNLSRNSLASFHIFPNNPILEELILSHNYLSFMALSYKGYPNLTNIDLSFNKIDRLALSFKEPIRKLDLTSNSLENIDVFDVNVEELRISLNKFTRAPDISNKTKKISLNLNPWECNTLENLERKLHKNNVQMLSPEDDKRLNSITKEERHSLPVCCYIPNSSRGDEKVSEILELLRKTYIKDIQVCDIEEDCPSNMLCRTNECVDPCEEDVGSLCDFTSVCETKNHQFTCTCQNNAKRNPLDLYSRCYNIECFTDDDCPNFISCEKQYHTCEFTPYSKKYVKEKLYLNNLGGAGKIIIQENGLPAAISSAPPRYPWFYDSDVKAFSRVYFG